MLLTVFLLLVGVVVILTAGLVHLFTPPRDFPKDIPTIPFYYTLLPLIQNNDQVDLYRKYLERPLTEYGAVKLFFGGRWNILVRKPEYIAEVFKHEDIYAKSGNQKKIPHGVLAEYTGDNIISAHGDNWRLYTSIIKPGLQQDYDPAQIWDNSRLLVDLLLEQQISGGSVVVNSLLQRYTLANLSEVLLGTSFEVCSLRKRRGKMLIAIPDTAKAKCTSSRIPAANQAQDLRSHLLELPLPRPL